MHLFILVQFSLLIAEPSLGIFNLSLQVHLNLSLLVSNLHGFFFLGFYLIAYLSIKNYLLCLEVLNTFLLCESRCFSLLELQFKSLNVLRIGYFFHSLYYFGHFPIDFSYLSESCGFDTLISTDVLRNHRLLILVL